MDIDQMISKSKEEMEGSIAHLKDELVKIRAGKASPSMLAGIKVDYYGSLTPLSQVANISTTDAKTLNIQPWEKTMLGPIEQAIFAANLGLTPMNDGENVRINIPALTEERRRELVKQGKSLAEQTKVSLRGTRQKMMDFVKKEVKDGYPEDAGKKREEDIQKLTNSYGDQVNKLIEAKEKDIMTV